MTRTFSLCLVSSSTLIYSIDYSFAVSGAGFILYVTFLGLPLLFLIARLLRALRVASCSAKVGLRFKYGGTFLRSHINLLLFRKRAFIGTIGSWSQRARRSGASRSSICFMMSMTLPVRSSRACLFWSKIQILWACPSEWPAEATMPRSSSLITSEKREASSYLETELSPAGNLDM